MGDEMRLVLHPIPDEPTLYGLASLRHLRPARKVPVKVLPLHVGSTEGYKDRRHVSREETGLSIEVTTLVPPKGTRPCQSRTLPDDLWKERLISPQSISKLLPVKILET
jgi:hypothetical protein